MKSNKKYNQKTVAINNLTNLVEQINLNLLNIDLVKCNINKLEKTYLIIKKIWDEFDENQIERGYIKKDGSEKSKYNDLINIVKSSFLFSNQVVKDKINHANTIYYLKYANIYFYWIDNSDIKDLNTSTEKDYLLVKKMFMITVCLNIYKYNKKDKKKRIIIWIPIKTNRDFEYDKITELNLKEADNEFEAFVASGVTMDNFQNKKITIITRYEEVEKLLIHELIHNYNMDGSNYHDELKNVIQRYKLIKNPVNKTKEFNYDYEYSIYESYTELLSTYFYLIFSNLKSNTENKYLKKKLLRQVLIEVLYSYNVIANLIKLNGYQNYDEFHNKQIFKGNICVYEYYYIKGLMYNNFNLESKIGLLTNSSEFGLNYGKIIDMIERIKMNRDVLLEEIFNFYKNQQNFKYELH